MKYHIVVDTSTNKIVGTAEVPDNARAPDGYAYIEQKERLSFDFMAYDYLYNSTANEIETVEL